ncbi:LysR family transcriptional regulator [Saccharopolyspora taberi]|uniref:LysR family transcriptional regulator n=1 Tax=Saccharopolyspora taberi TaxID=60895 RepID=UPI0031DD15B5
MAAELHLAQPSLSRQIQRPESRPRVRLFDRTPQGSQLTEAGAAFLPQAEALLHAARQAAVTARLRVGRQGHHRVRRGPGHHPGRPRPAPPAWPPSRSTVRPPARS